MAQEYRSTGNVEVDEIIKRRLDGKYKAQRFIDLTQQKYQIENELTLKQYEICMKFWYLTETEKTDSEDKDVSRYNYHQDMLALVKGCWSHYLSVIFGVALFSIGYLILHSINVEGIQLKESVTVGLTIMKVVGVLGVIGCIIMSLEWHFSTKVRLQKDYPDGLMSKETLIERV